MSIAVTDSKRAQILVVEDSSVFREMQGLLLGQAGYGVSSHESPQAALAVAAKQHFDLVLIDYELPEMNGQQFMHALRKIQPEIAVVFVSGSLTLDLAIQLSSQGVAGIFNKPANPKTLLEKINETLARNGARDTAARVGSNSPMAAPRRADAAAPAAATEPSADRLAYAPRFVLGSSERFREFTHRLWKVRDFRAVLLLQGEPGSPFEPIARELAEISIFRDGPIMVCPGAKFDARNLIEVLAPSLLSHDAGTLVVTGIEAFTADQQKILENLITGRDVFLPFARRFRLVLAAGTTLSDRVDDGTFGETLYYKISSLSLTVPALREMRSDIVTNARRILAAHRDAGFPSGPLVIAADAARWLEEQSWPGNYDELVRTVLSAARHATGSDLTLAAIHASSAGEEVATSTGTSLSRPVPVAETGEPAASDVRPPFPIKSDLATVPPPAAAMAAGPAAAVATVAAPPAASIARAPAGSLFARAAAPARPLTAQSLFRPASKSYDFSRRLAESLATADTAAAH